MKLTSLCINRRMLTPIVVSLYLHAFEWDAILSNSHISCSSRICTHIHVRRVSIEMRRNVCSVCRFCHIYFVYILLLHVNWRRSLPYTRSILYSDFNALTMRGAWGMIRECATHSIFFWIISKRFRFFSILVSDGCWWLFFAYF